MAFKPTSMTRGPRPFMRQRQTRLDPRYIMAMRLMGREASMAPVQSVGEGLARVGKAGLEGYFGRKMLEDYEEKERKKQVATAQALAKALSGAETKPWEVPPGTDVFSGPSTDPTARVLSKEEYEANLAPSGGMAGFATAAAGTGNLEVMGLGMQARLSQLSEQQALAGRLLEAKEKEKTFLGGRGKPSYKGEVAAAGRVPLGEVALRAEAGRVPLGDVAKRATAARMTPGQREAAAEARTAGELAGGAPKMVTVPVGDKKVTYVLDPETGEYKQFAEGEAFAPKTPPSVPEILKLQEALAEAEGEGNKEEAAEIKSRIDRLGASESFDPRVFETATITPSLKPSIPDVDYTGGTGPSGFFGHLANKALGAVGIRNIAPEVEEAKVALDNIAVRTRLAFRPSGFRPTTYLMELIGKLTVEPASLFEGDDSSKKKFKQTLSYIESEMNGIKVGILDRPKMFTKKPGILTEALINYGELERLRTDYKAILKSFYEKELKTGDAKDIANKYRDMSDDDLRKALGQ